MNRAKRYGFYLHSDLAVTLECVFIMHAYHFLVGVPYHFFGTYYSLCIVSSARVR